MRKLIALSVAIVMILSLVACASSGGNSAVSENTAASPVASESAVASGSPAAGEQTTITWWVGSWKCDGRAQGAAASFEAANPNIKVEITPVAWDGMREMYLSTLMSGHGGPDLMSISSSWAPAFAATGGLSDVSQIIDDIGRDKFYEDGLGWAKYNGVEYGVPYRNDTQVLMYNKAMYEKAGLSGPPTTLAEFADYAAKLTGDGMYGYVAPFVRSDINAGLIIRYIMLAHGGDIFSADEKTATLTTPEAIEAFRFLVALKDSMPPDATALNNDESGAVFSSGQAGMIISGPWRVQPSLEGGVDIGLAVLPGLNGPNGSWGAAGWLFAIPAASNNKEAAGEFMKSMLTPEMNAEISDALPAIRAASTLEKYQNDYTKAFLLQLDHMHSDPALSSINAIFESVAVAYQRMLMGEDIETVAAQVNMEVQALIDQAE